MTRTPHPLSVVRLLALLAFLALLVTADQSSAQSVPLDGPWEIVRSSASEQPNADAQWSGFRVPEFLNFKADLPFVWYRTRFASPKEIEGKRLFLKFHGVQYSAKVLVNGKYVGDYVGGGEPFEVEVTDAVQKTGSNELLVCAGDIRAVIDGELNVSEVKRGERLVEHLSDAVMHPVGSKYSSFGIWEPVELVVRDTLYLDDVFIRTSVREKTIAVDFTVRNLTNEPQPAILSAKTEGLDLENILVEVPAKGRKTVTINKRWAGARLWSPKDPHLYTLDIRLTRLGANTGQDGKLLEHRRERFGFREFWIEGTKFVLNGTPMTFLGTSKHPNGTLEKELSKEGAHDLYRRIRTANCNAIRLHANLWPKHWFDAADEDGMPLILESGLWCFSKQYALSREAFWKNYDRHLHGMIKKYRNHPAIMMVSLENEILHCGGERYYNDCEARLADAGRKFKKLDPTRPIMYDGDEDPGGVADVINLHYPIDFKKDTLWPQVCWWLDEGKEVAGWPRKFWKWDRKKPLYMGEFLHLQQFQTVEPYSLLLGDEAFAGDFQEAMARCKAAAWSMQIPAYRAQGVSGMCPWVVTESGPFPVEDWEANPRFFAVKEGYEPIAVFDREGDCGNPHESVFDAYYDDRPLRRTMDILNDTDRPFKGTFRWTVEARAPHFHANPPLPVVLLPDGPIQEGRSPISLPPAGRDRVEIRIDLPKLKEQFPDTLAEHLRQLGGVDLALDYKILDEEGRRVWPRDEESATKEFHVGPMPDGTHWRSDMPEKLGIMERKGEKRLAEFLRKCEIAFRSVDTLTDLGDIETLLIGPNALGGSPSDSTPLSVGSPESAAELIRAFLGRGGRVVMLRHEPFPQGFLPVQPIAAPTAALYGEWPFCWLNSSTEHGPIANSVFSIPTSGGAIPSGRAGGPTGLDRTPALLWFVGNGALTVSQYRIAESLDEEPGAAYTLFMLLSLAGEGSDALGYSETPRCVSKLGLVAEHPPIAQRLANAGVLFDDLSGHLAATELADYRVLLLEAGIEEVAANVARLKAFAENGGTLVLHGPMNARANELRPLFPTPVRVEPHRGPVTAYKGWGGQCGNWPLFDFRDDDFAWYAAREGLAWRARTPLADDVAPFVVIPGKRKTEPDPLGSVEDIPEPIEVGFEKLKVVEGKPSVRKDCIAMSMRGAVGLDRVGEKDEEGNSKWGRALLTVSAKGTPADGEWPQLAVSIGGKRVGTLIVDREDWCERSLIVELYDDAPVELEFVNDAWNPEKGEDRNVYIRSVRFTPWDYECTPYCLPAALIEFSSGKGKIFLDQINWTAPKNPTEKADRYLSLFLANLGVAFENPLGVLSIPGAEFETLGKEVSRGGSSGIRHMWANGKVEKTVRFGSDGTYRFSVRASGTPLEGGFPEFRLSIDDMPLQTFRLEDAAPARFRVSAPMKAGEHRVGIEFMNDQSSETEDRNLRVHEVQIGKE